MVTFKRLALAVVCGVMALFVGVPATAQAVHSPNSSTNRAASRAAVAWDSQTGAALAAWDCNLGTVCFWSDQHGRGARCMWAGTDKDWTRAPGRCSWSGIEAAGSVRNRGRDASFTGVAYYRWNNAGERVRKGCIRRGERKNLPNTYTLHAHIWAKGAC